MDKPTPILNYITTEPNVQIVLLIVIGLLLLWAGFARWDRKDTKMKQDFILTQERDKRLQLTHMEGMRRDN